MTKAIDLRDQGDRYAVTVPNRMELALDYYNRSPIFRRAVETTLTDYTDHEITRYSIRGFLHIHAGGTIFIDKGELVPDE